MRYHWHLRSLMAQAGMFATTDLVPLLAERGVVLSREQVYRLVARVPERLSLTTLSALCDILSCGPSELIEPYRAKRGQPTAPGRGGHRTTPADPGPGATRHRQLTRAATREWLPGLPSRTVLLAVPASPDHHSGHRRRSRSAGNGACRSG